jgi:hypothetical protein
MTIVISAVWRSDGMLDYSKSPGAVRSVIPPVYEKLEGQMEANNASPEEIEKFIAELNLRRLAVLSFPDRRNGFRAL